MRPILYKYEAIMTFEFLANDPLFNIPFINVQIEYFRKRLLVNTNNIITNNRDFTFSTDFASF